MGEANKGCVNYTLAPLAIYISKHLKANKELWKTQLFHHAKIYNLQKKNPLNETNLILQDIII